MLPDLPLTYYLDNVLTLFEHVSRVYDDILDQQQLEFLERFAELDADAQKLCIRLYNRSHDWYRASKLNYAEIESIEAALEILAQAGLVALDDDIEHALLLSLFTKAELLARVKDKQRLNSLRRDQLEATLLGQEDSRWFDELAASDCLVQLLRRDDYLILQMLFFGNLNQSMTDFVLRDLGLYQFESYQIDHRHRPYQNGLQIRQHWLLYQLETLYGLSDITDPAVLHEIHDLIPDDIEARSPAYRKSERLRYEIARQFERIEQLPAALALYRRCPLPPSRERVARIHDRLGDHRQALADCLQIIDAPLDEDELQFACMFGARLARRHGFDYPPAIDRLKNDHRPEVLDLELDYHDSVETAVAEYYDALEQKECCYFLENSLFNGVLGLLIWDALFAPLAGAFFNPFQYRASDFHAHDFCQRRAGILARTWEAINDNEDIWQIVSTRWQQKQGLMNPLVNWQSLDLDLIRTALERIDYGHWRAIFDRILRDLSNNRSGFPDLVHFPADGGYCLIEVKGPGDSLQKNQQRWMQYFHDHGIPHRLARVTWKTD